MSKHYYVLLFDDINCIFLFVVYLQQKMQLFDDNDQKIINIHSYIIKPEHIIAKFDIMRINFIQKNRKEHY